VRAGKGKRNKIVTSCHDSREETVEPTNEPIKFEVRQEIAERTNDSEEGRGA
jgi:hypothetical protein